METGGTAGPLFLRLADANSHSESDQVSTEGDAR